MTLCLETCPNNVVLTELGISIYKYVSQMLFPSEVCENRAFLSTDYLTQYSYTNAHVASGSSETFHITSMF